MNTEQARLDDALALGRHAADLAGWAAELARPDHAEPVLAVAEAVTATAVALTTLATALAGRRPAARHTPRPGDPR